MLLDPFSLGNKGAGSQDRMGKAIATLTLLTHRECITFSPVEENVSLGLIYMGSGTLILSMTGILCA